MFNASKVPTSDNGALASLYNTFNSQGRLDELYVYGYDEATPDKFQAMYDTFSHIHNTYPGLRTMTTAYDMSFGTSSSTSFLRSAVDINQNRIRSLGAGWLVIKSGDFSGLIVKVIEGLRHM